MIYITWGKLCANDTLLYKNKRYISTHITEDAVYYFYSTEKGVRYYRSYFDKISNYEIGKEGLFAIKNIKRK